MRKITWLAAIGLIVVGFAMFTRADDDASPLVGKAAPALSLATLDGKNVNLADQKGNVVLLDFWATWCPPCRMSLPHIQKISANKDLAAKGLMVWTVNDRETPDVIEKFQKDNSYTFTVLFDSNGSAGQSYLVQAIPTTVVVGRDGMVKNVFVGFDSDSTAQAIDDAVQKALAESK
ncbi:MAG TPA: TlpA disulfide reductase family protein [Tepidisphaeraceae bacterium]|jgi:peroxiredoxin|nr:TlpA disulfide reductase family protein [Tepidisphaeraceae bacterium]